MTPVETKLKCEKCGGIGRWPPKDVISSGGYCMHCKGTGRKAPESAGPKTKPLPQN